MVLVSENLIRKRAEHNECIISTLEEISLHQQDIERIQYIDKWCKELKILYLQSNLIPKIENVGKLKKLEYLNLALNNIELIENLEGCESLKKLDLTVNFIGELTSIDSLKSLYNLKDLFLTGNPCTDYDGYRDYVVATLPQLQYLDGIEIEKSERITAVQDLHKLLPSILQQQERNRKKRIKEKAGNIGTCIKETDSSIDTKCTGQTGDADKESTEDEAFWEEKTSYTPESRIKVHQQMMKQREKENSKTESSHQIKKKPLCAKDGRRLNVNEPKIGFSLTEDKDFTKYYLDVAIYKYMDTSLCDVDVQPTYVSVTIKGKVLQVVLQEEVSPELSKATRSEVSGHLLLTMPKANATIIAPQKSNPDRKTIIKYSETASTKSSVRSKREYLEADSSVLRSVDIASICAQSDRKPSYPLGTHGTNGKIASNKNSDNFSEHFIDDPEVPPLC